MMGMRLPIKQQVKLYHTVQKILHIKIILKKILKKHTVHF
nr:MAG TPA: hypothetical protein [Caudoviricetes sp.]